VNRYPKLCKALEYLVETFGPMHGRTRLLKLVFLADKCWAKAHGVPYTEAKYYRWNHGPFSREYLQALEWMDGIEIVEEGDGSPENGYTYTLGLNTRLKQQTLDPQFQNFLDEIGKQWGKKPLRSLLDYVYADSEFQTKNFGDVLIN